MGKITFSTLCILMVSGYIHGQLGGRHYATITPPFNTGFNPRGLSATSDGGYLVWGAGTNFPQSVCIFKVNANYEVSWATKIDGGVDLNKGVFEDDSLLVLSGYIQSPVEGRLFCLDKNNGTVSRSLRFPGTIRGFVPYTDSTFLVCGTVSSPSFQTQGGSPGDGFVVAMNVLGDTIWTDRFGVDNLSDDFYSIDAVYGGEYVVAGRMTPAGISWTPPFNWDDTHVVWSSPVSGLRFAKRYDFMSQDPTEFVTGVAMVGNKAYVCGTLLGGYKRGFVLCVDRYGNRIRDLSLGYNTSLSSSSTKLNSIMSGINGGVLVTGTSRGQAFAAKLSDSLTVVWAKNFYGPFASDACLSHDANHYIVLSRTNSPHGFRLTTFDQYGNDGDVLCGYDTLNFTVVGHNLADTTRQIQLLQESYPYVGFGVGHNSSLVSVTKHDSCLVATTLPIELVSFDVKVFERSALAEWVTASETDNDYFEVLRGSNPWSINEVVGRIGGAGTSQQVIYYQLHDNNPLVGTSYYQLRQVDRNLTTTYSRVVSITLDKNWVVWPNPTRDFLYGIPRGVNVSAYDMTGRLVKLFIRSDEPINLSELFPGTYFLQTDDGRKHIIQKE